MAGLKLTNLASTLLASQITDSDDQLAVSSGTGALFPTLSGSEWFPVVVVAADGGREIMRATARTGDVITVTRAQESTSARGFDPGSRVDLRVTAAAFADIVGDFEDAVAAATASLQGQLNAPSGTRTTFQQTAAPTGWTKESSAAYNDAAVISTTGSVATAGTVAASTLFARTATDGHVLIQGELPTASLNGTGTTNTTGAHVHTQSRRKTLASGAGGGGGGVADDSTETINTGSAGDHAHTVAVTVPLGGSDQEHAHNIDMRVKRYSVIVAQKD